MDRTIFSIHSLIDRLRQIIRECDPSSIDDMNMFQSIMNHEPPPLSVPNVRTLTKSLRTVYFGTNCKHILLMFGHMLMQTNDDNMTNVYSLLRTACLGVNFAVLGCPLLIIDTIDRNVYGTLRTMNAAINAIITIHIPEIDGTFGFMYPNDPGVSMWIHLYNLNLMVLLVGRSFTYLSIYAESLLVPYKAFLVDMDTSAWMVRRARCATHIPISASMTTDPTMDTERHRQLCMCPVGIRLMSELVCIQICMLRNMGWLL